MKLMVAMAAVIQYKLDIIQFADDYDVILWLDSDTIVVPLA